MVFIVFCNILVLMLDLGRLKVCDKHQKILGLESCHKKKKLLAISLEIVG